LRKRSDLAQREAAEDGNRKRLHLKRRGEEREDEADLLARIEKVCAERGFRMTEQRRVIADVLAKAHDHPDVDALHRRAVAIDSRISLATVYRTVRTFEEAGILTRHDFGDGRARYEQAPKSHHDHLIDLSTGNVVEFRNEEIEELQRRVAQQLGFKLVDHRLELYAVPADGPASPRGKRGGN
jgi:Fur family transcriptional regulator, ferric uptake regulator